MIQERTTRNSYTCYSK